MKYFLFLSLLFVFSNTPTHVLEENRFQVELKSFYSNLNSQQKVKTVKKYMVHIKESYQSSFQLTPDELMKVDREIEKFALKVVNAEFESASAVVKAYSNMMYAVNPSYSQCPSEIITEGWFDATCELTEVGGVFGWSCTYTCFDWSRNSDCTLTLPCNIT